MKQLFLVGVLFFSSMAFADLAPGSFKIDVPSSKLFLFDQQGQSCKVQILSPISPADIMPMKLVLKYLRMNWTGSTPLLLDYMKVTLTSPQINYGEQTFFISGSELSYLWMGSPGLPVFSPQAAAYTTAPACIFEMGDIVTKNRSEFISGTGKIRLSATYKGDDGTTWVPISAETSFSFESAQ